MNQAIHENSGYRPVRAWIILSTYTCLAAIFVGLLIPSGGPTNLKLYIPSAMFFFAVLSQFLVPYVYPNDNRDDNVSKNICCTVCLIWLPFPIVAAINAWGVAVGVYDPILHDQYPHSLGSWWTLTGFLMAIGIVLTTVYFRKSVMLENAAWHPKYFWASWGLQLITWLASNFG